MTTRPRQLRRNASNAENRLWYMLRNRGLAGRKFVRQMQIGPYIVDLACREEALIVELDGGQHAESIADQNRTAFLNAEGYGVLRFWNNEILENRDGVLATILSVIDGTLSPDLRFAPATLSPTERGTRGIRAAASSQASRLTPSILLPVGEKVARPRGETDEGVFGI